MLEVRWHDLAVVLGEARDWPVGKQVSSLGKKGLDHASKDGRKEMDLKSRDGEHMQTHGCFISMYDKIHYKLKKNSNLM